MKTIVKKPIIAAIALILFIFNCSYAVSKAVVCPNPKYLEKVRIETRNLARITDADWEKECERACLLKAKHQENTKVKTKKEIESECKECVEDCSECLKCGPLTIERIAEEFISLLSEKPGNPQLIRDVSMNLIFLGKPAVKPLVKAIQEGSKASFYEGRSHVQIYFIEILGNMGDEAREAEGVLVDKLHTGNVEMRIIAARALGKISPTRSVVDDLVNALSDENSDVRMLLAIALGKIGLPALPATAKLLRVAIGDDEIIVRKAAISAVGNFGSSAKLAVPTLMIIMNKESTIEEKALSLYAAKSLLQINSYNRDPAEKIISSIDLSKEKDFASHLLFKLGNIVKPDIKRALLREQSGSMMYERLSTILRKINAKLQFKNRGAK